MQDQLNLSMRMACVKIAGGPGLLGTDRPIFPVDGEGPLRQTEIAPFRMSATAITNQQFAEFTTATGYKTDSEKLGWSFVFKGAVLNPAAIKDVVAGLPWWCQIPGASWRAPKGPGSTVDEKANFPVVHISWNDATEYADWAGASLPTEAQWEHAARAGQGDVLYPWGDVEPTDQNNKCRVGLIFSPELNPNDVGPIAANSHDANGYGLFNMVGNVWEWTRDNVAPAAGEPQFLLKGGSYLCHRNSCYRYRIAARISNTVDSATDHTGFRIVFVE